MVYHPTISGKTRIHSAKIFVTIKVSGQNYLILKKAAFYRQNCNFGLIWVNKITFNTKSISSQLVSYYDSYILLAVDIKFATSANALLSSLRSKNTYEMVNSIKIQLNDVIISNEDYIYYSNMIPHLLENSKTDNLLYRGINLHDNTTFNTNTNKNIL